MVNYFLIYNGEIVELKYTNIDIYINAIFQIFHFLFVCTCKLH